MTSPEYESSLPRVEEYDLLTLLFDDVVEPTHETRWEALATTNPILARELARRAYAASRPTNEALSSAETQKIIVDIATLVVAALELAAKRISETSIPKDSQKPQKPI